MISQGPTQQPDITGASKCTRPHRSVELSLKPQDWAEHSIVDSRQHRQVRRWNDDSDQSRRYRHTSLERNILDLAGAAPVHRAVATSSLTSHYPSLGKRIPAMSRQVTDCSTTPASLTWQDRCQRNAQPALLFLPLISLEMGQTQDPCFPDPLTSAETLTSPVP